MANKPVQRGSGPARFRVVVVEAEAPDGGDLTGIAQAVYTALRSPPQGSAQRVLQPPRAANGKQEINGTVEESREIADESPAEAAEPAEVAASARPRAPSGARKYRTPRVLDDVNLTTDPPFGPFAELKKPDSHEKRFLVAPEWWKEARKLDEVSVDHIFTCYKVMGWPTDIDDFGAPLRQLKADGLASQKKRGLYAINHVGSERVRKMGTTA